RRFTALDRRPVRPAWGAGPREVVKEALRLNAAAVIISHNHPSGNPEPSAADRAMTSQLRQALALVDVRTLDHIIVAGGTTTSFAERGLI
ncbi:JAB domain-containing protein, partial [Pseudomonas aeruginosa]|uniref:JAB domain-containing protein n=1 Tax=Pseudomonas aeruginosa TaxID=287 RepID=UPI003969BDDF